LKYQKVEPVFKGVFFDFDGTLVNSEPLHFQAEECALKSRGVNFNLVDKKEMVGGTVKGTAEQICLKYGIEDIDSFFIDRQLVFNRLVESKLDLMPGAKNLLSSISEAGVVLSLVTSAEPEYVLKVLKNHRIDKLFNTIITMTDVDQHKPNPDPYLKALKLTSLKNSECLAIEDSLTGITSAQKADIPCIYVGDEHTGLESMPDSILKVKSLLDVDIPLLNELHIARSMDFPLLFF